MWVVGREKSWKTVKLIAPRCEEKKKKKEKRENAAVQLSRMEEMKTNSVSRSASPDVTGSLESRPPTGSLHELYNKGNSITALHARVPKHVN